MIEKGLTITGSEAELLSNTLSEVKTKSYEESEAQLDNTQDLMCSCHPLGASEMPRIMEKKNVTRILAPYENALC